MIVGLPLGEAAQKGFFETDERLKEIPGRDDDLDRLTAIVYFEALRSNLA